jgi:hypothetical protein
VINTNDGKFLGWHTVQAHLQRNAENRVSLDNLLGLMPRAESFINIQHAIKADAADQLTSLVK